jgi:hypothetical protein
MKQNWFPTLNQALESENLVDYWPLVSTINYSQTVRHTVELDRGYMLISVTRENNGMYERPIHYRC